MSMMDDGPRSLRINLNLAYINFVELGIIEWNQQSKL